MLYSDDGGENWQKMTQPASRERLGMAFLDRNTGWSCGGSGTLTPGGGGGLPIKTSTADWVYHEPTATNTVIGAGTSTQRVPLVLYHLEGMRYEEIADKLGVSLSKVKTDIYRGREALRKKLRLILPPEARQT
jgi:hypothetical protein